MFPYTDEQIEEAARVANETNRGYCQFLGDMTPPAWDEAPDWQRDSVRAGVRAIATNPDLTPAQSHEGWLAHKRADGWAWGATKDPEKKLHPCFVPYEQMPAEHRAKDHIFGAVVRAVLGIEVPATR